MPIIMHNSGALIQHRRILTICPRFQAFRQKSQLRCCCLLESTVLRGKAIHILRFSTPVPLGRGNKVDQEDADPTTSKTGFAACIRAQQRRQKWRKQEVVSGLRPSATNEDELVQSGPQSSAICSRVCGTRVLRC